MQAKMNLYFFLYYTPDKIYDDFFFISRYLHFSPLGYDVFCTTFVTFDSSPMGYDVFCFTFATSWNVFVWNILLSRVFWYIFFHSVFFRSTFSIVTWFFLIRSPKGIVSIHCEIRIGTLENHLKSLFQISKISIRDDSLDPEELTGNDTTPWVVLDVVATRVTMSLSMYAFSLQNAKFWTVLGEEDLAKGWKRQHVWKNQ